jgi:hypothetical protein
MAVDIHFQTLGFDEFGPVLVNHGSSGWHWSGKGVPAVGLHPPGKI